jgi:exopolyphosphatase/guanosine-5'-triphosphate,3'-diphosphate pyrophosphatase
MRLGVLDVGSNTVHLLVVDAHQGARPLPAFSHKEELHLADHLDGQNRLTQECTESLLTFVREALQMAEDKGVQELIAFATSAVRDAANGDEVLTWIKDETGVAIGVLPGSDESRLTFLAARRWFGWSSGRLLLLDIGGGSLEIASGQDEDPSVAVSLPLGANRLSRDWLTSDPPDREEVRRMRKHVRAEIASAAGAIRSAGDPDHFVATSKTFRQLARIAGAAPSSDGPYARRVLRHSAARDLADRLPRMSVEERAQLPGVSMIRAPQLAAGAIVADAAMDLLHLPVLEICPWALREGVILRRMDGLGSLAVEAAAAAGPCLVEYPVHPLGRVHRLRAMAPLSLRLSAALLGIVQLGTMQLRTGELRTAELGTGELRTADFRAGDLRALKLRAAELGTVALARQRVGLVMIPAGA